MPVPNLYYLNAPSLGSATAVFYDAALTIFAADGYYSDGVITREQISGVLLPQENCPFCGTSCVQLSSVVTAHEIGAYYLSVDTGNTPGDVGAIIIEFNPNSIPNGIKAVLNTSTYNELSSPSYGYLASDSATSYTFIGNTADNCGQYGSGSSVDYEIKNYDGLGTWVPSGTTETVSLDPTYTKLTAGDPGKCIMVVPKLNNSYNTLFVQVITACEPDDDSIIRVYCPRLLRSFFASTAEDDTPTRCALPLDQTYYVAPVNGVNPYIGMYDWIFTDAYGENKLADGMYKTNFATFPNDTITVQDGVVINMTQTC